MKIIFIAILYIFFVFLIKSNVNENFDECPASCSQKMSDSNISNLQNQVNQLSSQVASLSGTVGVANSNATKAINTANDLNQQIEKIKNELTKDSKK